MINFYPAESTAGYFGIIILIAPGDMVSFIVSMNFHRRSLDESQRAMVGAKIKHIFEDDARKRVAANLPNQPKGPKGHTGEFGKSRDKAAKMVNSSSRSVERASKVLKSGIPELVQAVESGKLTVTRANEGDF